MNWEKLKIDRASKISIADQISDRILKSIMCGELAPGDKLPPERDLSEILNVSRGTVKRAYAKLVSTMAIDMRQGSGSYVLKNGRLLEQNQKKEASEIISDAFDRVRGMGLSDKEILNLANLLSLGTAPTNNYKKINIMVASNNYEILSELEQQLSYLTHRSPFWFTLTYLTLDAVMNNSDPVQMLLSYDLIIASSIDYPQLVQMVPVLKNKILEVSLSPRTRTLVHLSELAIDSKITVLYRTPIFRDIVLQSLTLMGFQNHHITCIQEQDYNPISHNENGTNVLVNFNESPVYINPAFKERNELFIEQGGNIIKFEYQIERKALVYLEDQIQQLIENNKTVL